MMNVLISKLNLTYEWRFRMFGSLAEDQSILDETVKSMSLGILPNVFEYNAIHGRTPMDDMSMSNAVVGLDLLQKRVPLITSYSAKNGDGNLPPYGDGEDTGAGRPETDGITSDGKEADEDDAKRPLFERM